MSWATSQEPYVPVVQPSTYDVHVCNLDCELHIQGGDRRSLFRRRLVDIPCLIGCLGVLSNRVGQVKVSCLKMLVAGGGKI